MTLGRLVDLYLGAYVGARESNTLGTARIHANHLKRTLGEGFSIQTLTAADLQSHVERREKMKGRSGRPPTRSRRRLPACPGSGRGRCGWAT